MIREVEIQNFKCIKNLKIEGFSNVNFFVGSANSGKTTVLEALYLLLGSHNYIDKTKRATSRVLESRGMLDFQNLVSVALNGKADFRNDAFEGLFYDGEVQNPIKIHSGNQNLDISFQVDMNLSLGDNKKIKTLSVKQTGKKQFDNVEFVFHDFRLELLNRVVADVVLDADKEDKFNEMIQGFDDERIQGCRYIGDSLYVRHKHLKKAVNIKQMGQGFGFVLTIFALIARGDKVIIIDELENGLHYTAMDLVLKTIFKFASDKANQVQFFISTHSLEVLQKANLLLDGGKFGEDLARVFRTKHRTNGEISYISYKQDEFIKELDLDNEIRGLS